MQTELAQEIARHEERVQELTDLIANAVEEDSKSGDSD
jgi:predicted secreted Zn-dependent protease